MQKKIVTNAKKCWTFIGHCKMIGFSDEHRSRLSDRKYCDSNFNSFHDISAIKLLFDGRFLLIFLAFLREHRMIEVIF